MGIEVGKDGLDLPDNAAYIKPLFHSRSSAISHLLFQYGVFEQLDHASRVRPDMSRIDDETVVLISHQLGLSSITSGVRNNRKTGRHRFGDGCTERLPNHCAVSEHR